MSNQVPDANHVKRNGWRQGSVLPQSLVVSLVHQGLIEAAADNERFVVISHDCDVTNRRFDVEPSFEVLRAKQLDQEQIEGNRTWGKNPREYHLEHFQNDDSCIWEFSIRDRFVLPRTCLAETQPDSLLAFQERHIRALTHWVARRYVRAAFPDAFVDRTRPAKDRLRKPLKNMGKSLTAIFIIVSDDELPEDEPYRILVYGSMLVDDYANREKQFNAQKALNAVEAALGSCKGIEVNKSILVSEADLSFDDRRKLKRWDFDDLTIRGQPISHLPPDE